MNRTLIACVAAGLVAGVAACSGADEKDRQPVIEVSTPAVEEPVVSEPVEVEPTTPEESADESSPEEQTDGASEEEPVESDPAEQSPSPDASEGADQEGGVGGGDAPVSAELPADPGDTPELFISPYYDYPVFTPSEEAPLDGFYPVADGEQGCLLEYRPVNAELAQPTESVEEASLAVLSEFVDVFGVDAGDVTTTTIPSGGEEFWTTSGELAEGGTMAIASRYEPVLGSGGEIRGRGMDVLMTCPAGEDAAEELDMLRPFLEANGW